MSFQHKVDRFGNIHVSVYIGGGPENPESKMTGVNHTPARVARWLRELADEIEVSVPVSPGQADR